MVFFCCDKCGESLKKNQVEKHSYRCHSRGYSCMDCQMIFTIENYSQHIKCITENQKYGGKDYIEKEAKGELKQNAWCDQVERATAFVKDPSLKRLLESVQGYSNIPRKEAKFINFLTNSCRIRDRDLCVRAWKAIAAEADKLRKEAEDAKKAQEEEKKKKEETEAAEVAKTKVDKEETKNTENQEAVTFKWKSTIKRKLKEAGGEMKVKKLRSAVLEEYKTVCGDIEDDSIFDEKLEKAGITVQGKVATLA